MLSEFLSFFKKLLVFSGLVGTGIFFCTHLLPQRYISGAIWFLFVFFIFTTAFIHYLLLSASKKKPQHFVRAFMAATSIKLFIYLLLITLYSFFNSSQAISFVLSFLILYLLYTAFEVATLMKHFNP